MLERKKATKIRRADEFYDQRLRSEAGEYHGVSKVDGGKRQYEEPVEHYLKTLHHRVLFEEITREQYVSIVNELTSEHVAKELKKQEPFKNKSLVTIISGVEKSNAWINKKGTLNVHAYVNKNSGTDDSPS